MIAILGFYNAGLKDRFDCIVLDSIVIPLLPECACSDVGTVDPSQPCEKVFGQCECKPGVTERKCDECERLYFDFSMTGCTSECRNTTRR